MITQTTISILKHQQHFISEQIDTGNYKNAEEVIHASLAFFEEYQKDIEALREELRIGEESGISPLSTDEIFSKVLSSSHDTNTIQ
jgi:putative addiction module CopG family antidote